MEERTKINRSGKIKSRIFALILLVLSCSLALVSFKSLNRSFEGMVMHKAINNGFIQKKYDLYIWTFLKDVYFFENYYKYFQIHWNFSNFEIKINF